jgi:hypothetical protein
MHLSPARSPECEGGRRSRVGSERPVTAARPAYEGTVPSGPDVDGETGRIGYLCPRIHRSACKRTLGGQR